MNKKWKMLRLFWVFCALIGLSIFVRSCFKEVKGMDVEPKVVGSAATDSVFITFGTIDTTYYPSVANADSLIILIYPPDNDLPESLGEGGSIFNRTPGYYEYHRKAVNADGDLGVYRVMIIAWRGGAERGIQTCSYTVTSAGTYYYGVIDSARDNVISIKSTTDKFSFSTGDSLTKIDKSDLWGLGVDMIKISNDQTAADNFETMLDGTGGQKLSLGQLAIRASGNDTAFISIGAGTGYGGFFGGGSGTAAHGLRCSATGGASDGVYITAGSSGSSALQLYSAGGGGFVVSAYRDAIELSGNQGGGSWYDIDLQSSGTLHGNLTGSVGSVTADVGITQAGADKVWGTTTRALTDKANFTLASGEYTNIWSLDISGYSGAKAGYYLKNLYDNQNWNVWDDGTRSLTDKSGFALAQNGLDADTSFTQLQGITCTALDDSFGGMKNKVYSYLDKSISVIDDNPWDNAVRSLTATGLDADTSFTNLQTVSAGIKAKTDKLTFNAQDSLIVDYSNIPTGGLTPAEHDTLFKIRNYSYAVEETIRAHAPHGNDWGQGGGGSGETDTALIKIMNNNNSWGAYYTWNYITRTLTSGAGSGANSVIIRCKQSSDSTNIAGAQIQVLDSIQNSTIGLLNSDSQGRVFFALNNGVYCVRIHKPGWQFTVPETLRVSGNKDTTYYAGAFNPGSPPLPILCRVYGWVYDINNQPVVGAKIEASIKTIPLRYENVIISPYFKSTTTDDEGYWYLDLYPNSVLSPDDTKYTFFIYSPSGTILKIETTVPNQASWELQW